MLALVAATAAVPSGILGLGHGAVLAGAVGHGAVVAGPVAHGAVVAGPAVPGAVVAGPVAHGAVVAGPVAHGAVVAGPIAHGAVVAGPVAGVGLGLGLGVGIGHGVTVAGPGTVPATIAGPSGKNFSSSTKTQINIFVFQVLSMLLVSGDPLMPVFTEQLSAMAIIGKSYSTGNNKKPLSDIGLNIKF